MIYSKKLNIVIVNCCLCENEWFKVAVQRALLPGGHVAGESCADECAVWAAGCLSVPHHVSFVCLCYLNRKRRVKTTNLMFGNDFSILIHHEFIIFSVFHHVSFICLCCLLFR